MTRHSDTDVLTAVVAHVTVHDLDGTLDSVCPNLPIPQIRLFRSFGDDNRQGIATLARWAASLDAATATRSHGPGGARLIVEGTLQATSRDIDVRVMLDVADTPEPDQIIPLARLGAERDKLRAEGLAA